MMSRTALSWLAAIGVALSALACGSDPNVKEVEAFRAKHEADYRRDYVPLAGLFSLSPGNNSAGSAEGNAVKLPERAPATAGTFVLEGNTVRFDPAAGVKAAI